jgi:hypothetical protein
MPEWIYPAAGTLLLGLLAVDVFRTAFHAEGRGGPINRRQNRALWRLVRAAGTRGGRNRPEVLSLAGPLMAVTTIAGWSLLLIASFGLIYVPYVLDFHYSPGEPGSRLLEAFYYSGILASTVGQGDVVAPDGWLRVLTVIQATAGFAFVTVAVTYVLAVYRELVEAQSLAAAIDARIEEGRESGEGPEAADWDREIGLRLGHVLESHFNYPILHDYRPPRKTRSVPWQVARLYRARRGDAASHGDVPTSGGAAAADTGSQGSISRRALLAAIRRYGSEVHRLFVRGEATGEGQWQPTESELEGIVEMLGYEQEAEA